MLNNVINSSVSFVFHILVLYIYGLNSIYGRGDTINSENLQLLVPIGAVLDVNSSEGAMMKLCMDMAISDFYSSHPNYQTRLQLHTKDAKTVLDVNFAVSELVRHDEVVAILGPQGSKQVAYAAEIGETVQVSIVSFTARNSALSHKLTHYSVRTAVDDAVRAEVLAAVCQRFEWRQAVILYEDTEYGSHFLSRAIKALQHADIRVTYMISIPTSADNGDIRNELYTIKKKETRVFLSHMNHELGSRLFALASSAGMMSKGYAWIITDIFSIFLNSIDSDARDSMEGVVGIRPYVTATTNLKNFHQRWERNSRTSAEADPIMHPNIYGLWAYDAVTALAIAVENARPEDSSLLHVNGTDKTGLGISSFGERLLSELYKTKFSGLAGDFELIEGRLKPSAFEIFNVIGNGERRIGVWTPERGIEREMSTSGEQISRKEVKNVVWPGDSVIKPNDWTIPPMGSLRVGVPWKPGFREFVNVTCDQATDETNATGFAIDIFVEALKVLPFHLDHTFHCSNDSSITNWSYDKMLQKIPEEFDMVVGDTTIWAPRAEYVDFSLPYSESGVVLVVKNKKPFDMWFFIRPLSWDLWLAIGVACILIGVVLRVLERGQSTAERPGLIYWSPIAILAFQERNMVSNKWSVLVLGCWLFMAFILMQSFTANLSAILTLDQLKISFSDEQYYFGYQRGSFMKEFLVNNLNLNESKLRPYSSVEEFHGAMSKGSKNGGIDAIFDELPYMKLLLNRHESLYKIVGPTYKTDGFGFAFRPESPLVRVFSKAILNVTQGPTMNSIELRNLGPGYSSQDQLSSVISQGTSSLVLHQFGGLFLVTGSFLLLALFCSETSIGRKLTHTTQHLLQTCLTYRAESSSADGDTTTQEHGAGNDGIQQVDDAPPAEGGDAQVTGNEAQQDISDSTTAQNAGEGIQNEGLELLPRN